MTLEAELCFQNMLLDQFELFCHKIKLVDEEYTKDTWMHWWHEFMDHWFDGHRPYLFHVGDPEWQTDCTSLHAFLMSQKLILLQFQEYWWRSANKHPEDFPSELPHYDWFTEIDSFAGSKRPSLVYNSLPNEAK